MGWGRAQIGVAWSLLPVESGSPEEDKVRRGPFGVSPQRAQLRNGAGCSGGAVARSVGMLERVFVGCQEGECHGGACAR